MVKSFFWIALLYFIASPVPLHSTSPVCNSNPESRDFELILPGIYRLQDAANVYLLKSGDSGILIDAGSDSLAAALGRIGVKEIDWVLHTHFHRDQCLGTASLRKAGARVAIGKLEEHYLQSAHADDRDDPAERYILNSEISNQGRRGEPFHMPGVDRSLSEGEVITWNQYSVKVIDTPGHTEGSVSYLVEVDGKLLCFSGDLIMKGGYVRDFYSMQWIYLQNPGIDSSLVSLDKVSLLQPDLLLPSHGRIINNPTEDLFKLTSRLEELHHQLTIKRAGRWNWSGFVQVSDHVIQDCGTTSQLIISESGEVLLFDCGKTFTTERLASVKQKFGIKRVDVIIPSHWHYDHIDGIPALAASEGAEVWVWEKLKEHVEEPENSLTTCWSDTKFKADRVLSEGESFQWGGYDFRVYHNPVHMEQQMGLSAVIDGLKFYFTADGSSINREGYMRSSIHCYNGISTRTGLIKTAQSFYSADPYICLAAHSNGFATHNDTRLDFVEWAVKTTDVITSCLMPGHSEIGFNPYWATFYPAKSHVHPGGDVQLFLRIINVADQGVPCRIILKGPDDIEFGEKVVETLIGPGETAEIPVRMHVGKKGRVGTHLITADIEFGNEIFGALPVGYIITDE